MYIYINVLTGQFCFEMYFLIDSHSILLKDKYLLIFIGESEREKKGVCVLTKCIFK